MELLGLAGMLRPRHSSGIECSCNGSGRTSLRTVVRPSRVDAGRVNVIESARATGSNKQPHNPKRDCIVPIPSPSELSTLSLRACLVIACIFWLDVSLVATLRFVLAADTLGAATVIRPATVVLACLLMVGPLVLATVGSWRVGYDLAHWRQVLVRHLVLALLFGLCAFPAWLAAAALLEGAGTAGRLAPGHASAARLWGAHAVENAAHYLVLQGILTAAAYYLRARSEQALRERMARQYDRARLQALRMQTNPHFLFNTLTAIAGLIRSKPDAAEAMVTRLGDLFRATLGNRDTEFVTLERELDLGVQYLEIQRTRFGDRFDFRIHCTPAAAAAAVPPLLLQPLLENASEHGLSGQDGRIEVEVRCACDRNQVDILVRNRATVEAGAQRDPARGFGLENVRERLRAAFGDGARFDAEHARDGFFEARIRFPELSPPQAATRS